MSIIEINFKCEHCEQEFWNGNFNIAVFLYGVFLLLGKENEYVGLTCPNCIKTILIKDNSSLVNYTKQNLLSGEHEMSFLIYLVRDKDDNPDYSQGTVPFGSKLRYHSSMKYEPKQIPAIKDLNIPFWSGQLTNNLENELSHYMGENPQLKEKYLCPYIEGGEPPIGPYISIWWFKEDQIDDLVKIENDEELRIFPRYIHKIFEIENIELFCWENHLYLNHLIEQKKEAEETIENFKEIAKQQNTHLQEILDANFGVTTPQMVEDMIKQYVENKKERKLQLSTNFVEILTAKPSPLELPIHNLSSYEFLWKMPHPFEDRGVPRSLIDVDPAQFKKPKKSFAFDKIASEARGYFEKGYGLNFIGENYEIFIKEYIELAQNSMFSYALVWELKVEYLEQLHDYCKSEYRQDARYAIFEEETGWTIIFDKKPIRGLKSKGFRHIYYLMTCKNKNIDTYELDDPNGALLEEIKYSEYRRVRKEDNDNINEGFKILGKERDRMPLIDDKARKSYEKKLRELELEINEAEANNNLDHLQSLKQQHDFIEEELNKTSYGGKTKTFADDSDTIRKTVVKRIERALKEIEGGKKTKSKFRKEVSEYFKNAICPVSLHSNSFKDNIDWFIG